MGINKVYTYFIQYKTSFVFVLCVAYAFGSFTVNHICRCFLHKYETFDIFRQWTQTLSEDPGVVNTVEIHLVRLGLLFYVTYISRLI